MSSMSTKLRENDVEARLERCIHEARARFRATPAAEALFTRATTAFMREILVMAKPLTAQAQDPKLLARDDKALLSELMIQALQADPLTSKETRLRLQGQLAFHRLLEQSGGAYTTAEVANLLGITPDAVRKRTRKGKLLAVSRGEHSIYPAFQFGSTGKEVVQGLDTILSALDTDSAPAKVRFLLTPDADLGETPIAALQSADRARHELVMRKARQFGRHTAR
jgi:hypothetical protein